MTAAEHDRRVCVGAIAGAFGVHGEVRIKSFCAEPAAIADYGPLFDEGGRRHDLRLTRPVKDGFAGRLSGVATREAAEALRGTRLYAARDRLPEPGAEEYYHADLIGLEVLDTGGALLGRVKAIFDHGAGDVVEVTRPDGRALLLPFTRAAVPTVDTGAGRLIADPGEWAQDGPPAADGEDAP